VPRAPHLPQIIQGPLAARPSSAKTPEWVWYFAWDDDGGAFWRPTREGWQRATPSAGPASWHDLELASGWTPDEDARPAWRPTIGGVQLCGRVQRSGTSATAQLGVLPPTQRPKSDQAFAVVTSSGLAAVSVGRDGVLQVNTAGGQVPAAVHLDGIRVIW
jgi:hypothetical protein